MQTTDTSFDVTLGGAPIFTSTNTAPVPLTAADAANAGALQAALSTPVLERMSDGSMAWSAVTPTALPSFAALTVDATLLGSHISSPSIKESLFGSILVDWDWAVSAPVACPAL